MAASKAAASELQVALEGARSQAAEERLSALHAAEAEAEEARAAAVAEAKREAAHQLAATRAAARFCKNRKIRRKKKTRKTSKWKNETLWATAASADLLHASLVAGGSSFRPSAIGGSNMASFIKMDIFLKKDDNDNDGRPCRCSLNDFQM